MAKSCLVYISEEDDKKINSLQKLQLVKNKKGKATPARTKILKFCLNKTYEIYKEQMKG